MIPVRRPCFYKISDVSLRDAKNFGALALANKFNVNWYTIKNIVDRKLLAYQI